MATYTPENLISHDLSCPICFEDYDILCRQRAPKLLLCLHTFCFGCAQRLWQSDGTLECSLCRTVHSGVALNDLFDNPIILEHLRKECEEQDLQLARRLDMEMRSRVRRNSESTAEVIDLTSPKVEQRTEERVPEPQPVGALVQLQAEAEGDEEEEEDLRDMADSGHSNTYDSADSGHGHNNTFDYDGTVEEEEEEESDDENDGRIEDYIDSCFNNVLREVAEVNNMAWAVVEALGAAANTASVTDDAGDATGDAGDVTDDTVDVTDDDAVNGIDDTVDRIDDLVNGIDDSVDGMDDVVERPHLRHEHQDDDGDDDTSSSDDNDHEDEGEDEMRQMMVTIPWINRLPPHVQSDEEDNEDERSLFDDSHEEDGVNEREEEEEEGEEEEEEEDRWHSASDEIMSPSWVEDDYSMDRRVENDYSMDDDPPDSPNLLDWLVL